MTVTLTLLELVLFFGVCKSIECIAILCGDRSMQHCVGVAVYAFINN